MLISKIMLLGLVCLPCLSWMSEAKMPDWEADYRQYWATSPGSTTHQYNQDINDYIASKKNTDLASDFLEKFNGAEIFKLQRFLKIFAESSCLKPKQPGGYLIESREEAQKTPDQAYYQLNTEDFA